MHSIRAQLFERQGDARAFALNPNLQAALMQPNENNRIQAQKTLDFLSKIYLVYSRSTLFDSQGKIIASTNADRIAEINRTLNPEIELANKQTPSRQNPSLDETLVSDFTKIDSETKEASITRWQKFTSPVRDQQENLIGYITNYADGLYLKREMENLANYFLSLDIKSTEIYLISNSVEVMAGICNGVFSLNCPSDFRIPNEERGVKNDEDILIAWVQFEDSRIKNIPNWSILLKTDAKSYYADIEKIRLFAYAAASLLLIVIFGSLTWVYFSRLKAQSELSKKMLEAQESERERISREIHDELGQNLTAIKIFLKSKPNESSVELQSRLNEASEMIDLSNDVLRRISHELHPSLLQNLGLIDSIKWKLKEISRNADLDLKLEFHHKEEVEKLSAEVKGHLYRIFQEALNNFLKHAKGTIFLVKLTCDSSCIALAFEDNGIGLNADQQAKLGLGLKSIIERVRLCQGSIRTGKSDLGGYLIEINLPLNIG